MELACCQISCCSQVKLDVAQEHLKDWMEPETQNTKVLEQVKKGEK